MDKAKAYVKNKIRRVLNRALKLYTPEVIVVENLRGFLKGVINRFPKSVKRVLMRFGLGEIRRYQNLLYCFGVGSVGYIWLFLSKGKPG